MAVFADQQHPELPGPHAVVRSQRCIFVPTLLQKVKAQQITLLEVGGTADKQRILYLPAWVGFARRED